MPGLASLIRTLAEANAPYLLIGGYAIVLHGHARNTFDLDLLVADSSLPAFRRVLENVGYSEFFSTNAFLQLRPPSGWLPVDLMVVDQETFDRLDQTAEPRRLDGEPVKVPDVLRLIALKLHAARDVRRTTREIDWLDIARILQVNQIALENAEFQAILQRYGGDEAASRIRSYFRGCE